MERFWKVLSLGLIVGIVAVIGVGMVFAQDDTPEPPLEGKGRGPWHWGHDRGGRKGFPGIDREEVKSRLADALGISRRNSMQLSLMGKRSPAWQRLMV